MKLYRNLIILVVVLLALAGAFAYVTLSSKSDATKSDDKKIEVSKFDAEKASELTVENTDGKYVFKKNGTEWEMTSGGNFKIDATNVNAIVTNAADLSAYKLVEEKASSLEKYGLANPYRVTIKMSDGTENVLEIGNMTATKEGYYVKKGNSVYVVYASTGDLLVASEKELRNKYIFDVYSTDITKFVLDRGGKRVFSVDKSGEKGWTMLEPIKGNINLVRLNTICESIVRASVTDYVEENAQDLSKYGLDNPTYVIEAATEKQKLKLILGKESETEYAYYAKLDGSNEVFTLDSSLFSFLDIKAIELCEGLVYAPTIYNVSEVVLNIDGNTRTLKIESDSAKPEEDKFIIDGIDVMKKGDEGESAFRNYYTSIIGIAFSDIELLDKTPTGTPEITITYSLESAPGKMVVEFIPKDDRNYYALKNGEYTGMVVKKSAFDAGDGPRKNYESLMKVVK
ncbi:DUF4340 domain-containing protein [Acetivibrio cellulolyticus]|uniref:DUF4340 domain-containing protein n=1 Tax=Acetivibrio cellulolyticus TaxID=35830 RepID=UPI0001E2FAFA|nr:DUF4340 domain-containing protein [Acetivibrio cellulolyticus]